MSTAVLTNRLILLRIQRASGLQQFDTLPIETLRPTMRLVLGLRIYLANRRTL